MLLGAVACTDDGGAGATTTATTTTYSGEDPDVKGHYVFVDTNGNDENDGSTPDKAVKTLSRANTLASEYISAYTGAGENVVISLGVGDYRITESFTPVSGNDYVNVYYLSRGGRARILGGVSVADISQKCTDTELLSKISDETARENIYEIDLSVYSEYLPMYYSTSKGSSQDYSGVGLYLGDTNLHPARWPNEGEVMPDNAEWANGLHGYAIAPYVAFIKNGELITPTEMNTYGDAIKRATPMAVYFLDSVIEHIRTWDWSRGNIYTKDFMANNWSDFNHKVQFIDGETVALDGNTYQGYIRTDYGRVYGGEMGEKGTAEGFRRAYFYNVLEEIDVAGEYYYDHDNDKMYIYLESEADLSRLNVSLCHGYIVSLSGTGSAPVRNVTLKNIDFAYSQGGGAKLNYSENVAFIGCNISNVSQIGVNMTYSKRITFRDCVVSDTGCGSFSIKNCEQYSKNYIGNAEILIENCRMNNVNDRDYTYSGAFVVNYVSGLIVRNCTMSGGRHNAAELRFVSNCIFEYNDIYDFMTDTDDLGLFYSYMVFDGHFGLVCRNNYLHDSGNTWQTWSTNVFYHDGYSIGYMAENNVIANIGVGNEKAQISLFTVPNAATFNNNFAYNIGGRSMITNEDVYLLSTSQWWRWINGMVLEGERDFDMEIALGAVGFFEGVWDDEPMATDPEINYTYNKLRELTSEEYKKWVFSNGAVRFTSESMTTKADYAAISMDTISDFTLEVFSGDFAGTHTFDTPTELFDFLSDNFNWSGATALPKTVQLKYKDRVAISAYYNIYTKNAQGEYEFTKTALKDTGLTQDTLTFDYYLTEKQSFIKAQTTNYTCTNIIILGECKNNVVINCERIYEYQFSRATALEYDNNEILYIDGFEAFDENGMYTLEFEDFAYDILSDYEFLDLSLVGAKL